MSRTLPLDGVPLEQRPDVHDQIRAIAADEEPLNRECAELAMELALQTAPDTTESFAALVRGWLVWEHPGATARILYRCAAEVPERRTVLFAVADALLDHQRHLDLAGRT